jgi:hypothetical protein
MTQGIPSCKALENTELDNSSQNLADSITGTSFQHPALKRIAQSLSEDQQAGIETQITSYDRMHHRHNRS